MTINDRAVINFLEVAMARYTSLDPNKYILIRNAAIELFYKQGMDKTSINDIAKEAGIAKGTIYLYFKSREELLESVFIYCFDMHMKASMKELELQKNCGNKLIKRIKNILLWNAEHPKESTFIRLYYIPVNIAGTENVAFSKSYEVNKKLIEQGIEDGEFKSLPINFLSSIFFSSVEAISKYVRKNPEVLTDDELLEKMLNSIVDGIRLM